MTPIATLQTLIAQGESETAELRRVSETLCAFLNGDGGKVLIGVAPTAISSVKGSRTSRSRSGRNECSGVKALVTEFG